MGGAKKKRETAVAVRERQQAVNDARHSVLVVEDDRAVRRMLGFALGAAGFEVREATTGSEALAALANEPTDAVLLDLTLPDGRGGEVLRHLQNAPPSTDKPRVWLTMSALDPQEATARFGEMGPRFVEKPFDPWHVVRLIESLLSR